MDKLEKCLEHYEFLLDKEFHYKFKSGKGKYKFKLFFIPSNFPHLIGLHKLKDIEIIRKFNDKENQDISANTLCKMIKNKKLTYKMIEKSDFFDLIKNRITYFRNLNELVFSKQFVKFVVDKTEDGSKVKAEFIVYLKKNDKYMHLFIAKNHEKRYYYPETYIVSDSSYFINNQKEIELDNLKMHFRDRETWEDLTQAEIEAASTLDENDNK
mgnify:CR=1 FL=1